MIIGRSSSFEVFSLGPEEVKMISLRQNSERRYKFGLVLDVSQLPDNPFKTYKANWYSLGEMDVETMIEIEKTKSGLNKVSRPGNGDLSPVLIPPQMKPKFFSESEKNTDTNWESFMERRGTYRQEGPIFLSYSKVRGSSTVIELGEELKSLVEKEIIR